MLAFPLRPVPHLLWLSPCFNSSSAGGRQRAGSLGLHPRVGNRAWSCSSKSNLKWIGRHALKVPLGLPQLQRQTDNYFRHLPWSHICLDEASLENVAGAGQTEGSSLLFTWLGAGWFLPARWGCSQGGEHQHLVPCALL